MPPGPGVPPGFPPEERHDIVSMACSPRAELWGAQTHWAVRPLARAAIEWGFVRRISKSTVHQWLTEADLKPHRIRRWLHSPDPEFRAKVRKLVRLYLHPPRGARVICVDEKTQVQVLEHTHPARPMRPGRPTRIEQTYRRHQEFLELLRQLRRRWPKGRLIIIVDNLSIHTHPRVNEWLHTHQGRVQLVFLPLHASWLNQIELWFSVLERQCLKRASVTRPGEMAARIYRFARHWNHTARPFRWTFKGYPLRR